MWGMMAWLTANEALSELGTKPQSLYASVSRGRIRAKPDPADPRKSLYDRDDVRRLAEHGAGRRKAATVAADAIRWGDPILPSAITTIIDGRLYYRGQDVVTLSASATLEDIAGLLWEAPSIVFPEGSSARRHTADDTAPLRAAFHVLADRAAADPPVLGRALPVLRREAAGIVGIVSAALIGEAAANSDLPLHERLATAWHRPAAADLIRRALVLHADHELNASTFAARVTISTGASLAAAVLSGLATLSGPLHGGAYAGLGALVDAAAKVGAPRAVRTWLAQGRPLPTFGHRLYPEGDIRAKALFDQFELPAPFAALAEAGRSIVGEEPNVDFAMTALAAALDLPRHAPLLLFATARTVGWLAHALEQTATGTLIRPRATYVGVGPERAE
jgi:citrate synthase